MLLIVVVGHKDGKGLGECREGFAQTYVLVQQALYWLTLT